MATRVDDTQSAAVTEARIVHADRIDDQGKVISVNIEARIHRIEILIADEMGYYCAPLEPLHRVVLPVCTTLNGAVKDGLVTYCCSDACDGRIFHLHVLLQI